MPSLVRTHKQHQSDSLAVNLSLCHCHCPRRSNIELINRPSTSLYIYRYKPLFFSLLRDSNDDTSAPCPDHELLEAPKLFHPQPHVSGGQLILQLNCGLVRFSKYIIIILHHSHHHLDSSCLSALLWTWLP